MARCLNPRAGGGHENLAPAQVCQRCDFLVRGARVGIYEVIAFLGEGSFGQVYKVREQEPLGRLLALKALRLDQHNQKAREGFYAEARHIAELPHPHILPIYNFGHLTDQRPYLVVELAPRTILDVFRKDDGSRRLAYAEELVVYLEQAAAALFHVHEHGVIHQDIKPGNLLIGRSGQILLADFGATFYLGMETHASLNEVTGTSYYMPKEQWEGHPRRDSDQYALAISIYELLAGRPPFVYPRIEQMSSAHFYEKPPMPQKWNPRIPVEVSAVLMRALEKDYHLRYPNVVQFAEHYRKAVEIAQARYVCRYCAYQNRTGSKRCSRCGAQSDDRICPYCETPVRFGQRCCTTCGRLTIPPTQVIGSPVSGMTARQGRYMILHVLKQQNNAKVTTAIALDTLNNDRRVILKRWECSDSPLERRRREIVYYERATERLATFHHPLVPTVLDRFAEGRHYYLIESYIDGESMADLLQKQLKALTEREVLGYMKSMLNIMMALEQHEPAMYHFDISPSAIMLERGRGRAMLTGYPIPPLPPGASPGTSRNLTTRKIDFSPYAPVRDYVPDRRTCIYMLAATMHHALSNDPPQFPFPPIRTLNPLVSPALEAVLSRALQEERELRYQGYAEMKRDIQQLV